MKSDLRHVVASVAVVIAAAPVFAVMLAAVISVVSRLPDPGGNSGLVMTGAAVGAALGALALTAFIVGMRAVRGKSFGRMREQTP